MSVQLQCLEYLFETECRVRTFLKEALQSLAHLLLVHSLSAFLFSHNYYDLDVILCKDSDIFLNMYHFLLYFIEK